MNKYIFGYGSLINLDSIAKTIERKVLKSEIIPTIVFGYSRIWNYKARVFSEKLNKNVDAVYLNLKESKKKYVNGIIFKISDAELDKLKLREKHYSLVDISDKTNLKDKYNIYTFICYHEDHLAKKTSEAYVFKKYLEIVNKGCDEMGPEFKQIYVDTTENIPFKIMDGEYKFIINEEG